MTTCLVCGKPLAVGEYPCILSPRTHVRATPMIQSDEIVGGFVQEHFGDQPEVFYSKSAMAARAKKLGLTPFVRHVDGDKHVKRWV